MLPKTLALIDDDRDYAEFLAQYLCSLGCAVQTYGDSNELLTDPDAFGYGFYLVDLMLPGVDGVELIKILRLRSDAGLIVVSGRLDPNVFKSVVESGADMYLAKPVQFEQVALAVKAVQRRIGRPQSAASTWKLDRRAGALMAPDGTRVVLSDIDREVMECFLAANGEPVSRVTLCQHLGREASDENEEGLNATIYRLRRRIERATPLPAPLQSKSRIGYVFKAPLVAA